MAAQQRGTLNTLWCGMSAERIRDILIDGPNILHPLCGPSTTAEGRLECVPRQRHDLCILAPRISDERGARRREKRKRCRTVATHKLKMTIAVGSHLNCRGCITAPISELELEHSSEMIQDIALDKLG